MRRPQQLRLYVEGGGDSDALHTHLRRAFTALLKDAGVQRLPRPVACGGRRQTLEDFKDAVEVKAGRERALLPVDSETAVAEGDSVWAHLRKQDTWEKPPAAEDNSAFLMVQCMETWLIADREALKRCFRPFNEKALEAWPQLEAVPKRTILERLERATPERKKYSKGALSFVILARVNAARVEGACPGAMAFFDAMRAL